MVHHVIECLFELFFEPVGIEFYYFVGCVFQSEFFLHIEEKGIVSASVCVRVCACVFASDVSRMNS